MLTCSQLQSIITGAVWVREIDGWLVPSRFSDLQNERLKTDWKAPYLPTAAGMKLEFTTTEGGAVSFAYHAVRGSVYDCFGVELAINGTTVHHIYSDVLPESGAFFYEIPPQEKAARITVYLPNVATIRMKDVSIPADFVPYRRSKKILCLGDSITQGAWTRYPRNSYVNRLGDALEAEVLNQGICGDYFSESRLDEALPFVPDLITVAYGTNDWGGGGLLTDAPKKYLDKLVSLYGDTPVFLLLPIWRHDEETEYHGQTLEEGRRILAELAASYDSVRAIDCHFFVPPEERYFWDKKLHPNDDGFLLYAQALLKEILS